MINPPTTHSQWSCQCYRLCPFCCRRSQKSLSWSLMQGCGSVLCSPHLWIFGWFKRPRLQNSPLHWPSAGFMRGSSHFWFCPALIPKMFCLPLARECYSLASPFLLPSSTDWQYSVVLILFPLVLLNCPLKKMIVCGLCMCSTVQLWVIAHEAW